MELNNQRHFRFTAIKKLANKHFFNEVVKMHNEQQIWGFQQQGPARAPEKKRILRLPEVKFITGLSKSTVYSRVAAGLFPRQVSMGGKAVGWFSSDIARMLDAYAACYNLEEQRVLVREIESERNPIARTDNGGEPASKGKEL